MMWLKFLVPLFYAIPFWFRIESITNYTIFLISLNFGYYFYYLDYFIFPFYGEPQINFQSSFFDLFKKRNYFSYLKFCWLNRNTFQNILTRSWLFVGLALPLTLLMITSAGSMVGLGLTLGLCLANLVFILSLKINTLRLNNFFNFYRRSINEKQLLNIKALYLVCVGFLTIIALFHKF